MLLTSYMLEGQEPVVCLAQIYFVPRCCAAPYSCFIWDSSHLKNAILLVIQNIYFIAHSCFVI